jgi:serine/threonine protein kinase/lipopolysaccharide biosynthesis regulator YciM
VISQAISHYRIIKKIGAGGMGEVYLAEDTRLGRKVAIKLLPQKSLADEQAKKRLVREAKAAAVLDHPNICAIHEVGEEGDNSFIIMQYVEGETLSSRLRMKGLTIKESLDIAIQVADALSEAHSRRIVHRDIKPQNIIITPRGVVKVLDFGLAKLMPSHQLEEATAETESLLTEANAIVGTAPYMSPEQVKRERLDGRSDLFSLGAMLYECIAGRQAFTGSNAMEICAQVLYLDPPPPSKLDARVPAELDRVIMKALAKEAEARYQSAAEMLSDLEKAREQLQAEDSVPTQQVPIKASTSRIRALWTLSNKLKQRRVSLPIVLALLSLAIISLLVIPRFWASRPYQPSPEARRWYDAGVNALRDGTYYQASKALEQAVNLDEKFALAHARLAETLMELDYTDRAQGEQLRAATLVSNRAPLSSTDELYMRAVNLTLTRNFAEAVETYSRIAGRSSDTEKAFAYLDLGRAYEKNEETDRAIDSYKEAIKRDPQYAAAFLRLGVLHGRKRDLKAAVGAFDESEKIYEAASNFEGVTESIYQRGYLFNKMGMIADAQTQFQKVLDRTRTTGNIYQQIKTQLQMSSISYREGNTARAKELATQAVDLARDNGLENLTSESLVDLGVTFYVGREYSEAEKYYRQAIEFARNSKGRRSEAKALLALGELYIFQEENTDEGVRLVEQALTFYQLGGYSKEISQALLLMGQAKLQKGDYSGALQDFDQQFQLAKQLNDPAMVARSHMMLGSVLSDQESYVEALHHFEQGYLTYESSGIKLSAGYALLDQANMKWKLGDYAMGRILLDRALSLAEQLDSKYKQILSARVYLANSQMALSQGVVTQAREQGQKALSLGQQNNRLALEAKLAIGLAQARSGAKDEGRLLCKQGVEMAKKEKDPRLLSIALLALSEALLESGYNSGALELALQAHERFASGGQIDSDWRSLTIAGLASKRAGDQHGSQEYLARARDMLSSIERIWGKEYFQTYIKRPDLQLYREQLD